MAAPKIFVCHSHKDDTFTERLVNGVRQAGADAWMDKTDLGAAGGLCRKPAYARVIPPELG